MYIVGSPEVCTCAQGHHSFLENVFSEPTLMNYEDVAVAVVYGLEGGGGGGGGGGLVNDLSPFPGNIVLYVKK